MATRISQNTIELLETKTKEVEGLPYLILQLDLNVTVAVQLALVRETVVALASRFTLMPNMQPWVIGLLSHRSSIFWTVDLPQLLGLMPLDTGAEAYSLAVLQSKNLLLGAAIRRVVKVDRYTEDMILSPDEFSLPASVVPYLRGCVIDPDGMVFVLDAEAIALTKLDF
jgi:positive phototaxis protein PixI